MGFRGLANSRVAQLGIPWGMTEILRDHLSYFTRHLWGQLNWQHGHWHGPHAQGMGNKQRGRLCETVMARMTAIGRAMACTQWQRVHRYNILSHSMSPGPMGGRGPKNSDLQESGRVTVVSGTMRPRAPKQICG